MGSIKRQLERKRKLAQQKEAKKASRKIEQQIDVMPKVCGECGADFDNADKEALNQWRIAVWDDGRINLTCPNCGPTAEEIAAHKGSKHEND